MHARCYDDCQNILANDKHACVTLRVQLRTRKDLATCAKGEARRDANEQRPVRVRSCGAAETQCNTHMCGGCGPADYVHETRRNMIGLRSEGTKLSRLSV